MMSGKIKKIVVEVCRILIGIVFIFSGFVKAVDPLGSAYKFNDYFSAFEMSWLEAISLPSSFLLSALEFALGVCILLGVYRKFTSFMILAFMLFMTPLTLYLAIANPVTDCGCFGDALVITNWETFFKNLILLTAAICIFLWHKYIWPVFSSGYNWLVTLYTFLFILGISFFCYHYLPILDFRPYKTGANIQELMVIPEGAPLDEYETSFIYEKDGVQKEFTLENYPSEDSTWLFVDSKSKLIKKGYTPPIHDFTITTTDGDDITGTVLSDPSYTFLLIAYKLEKANDSNIDKVNDIYDFSVRFNYPFYCLTASSENEINSWIENTGAEYPVCTTDEITLKTIIRSNPGLVLLKNGVVINKWPESCLPEIEMQEKPLEESTLGNIPPDRNVRKILFSACLLLIPLVFIYLVDFSQHRKKRK